MSILKNLQTVENNFAKKHWVIYLLFGFITAAIAIAAVNYFFFLVGGMHLAKETALIAIMSGAAIITRTYFRIKS